MKIFLDTSKIDEMKRWSHIIDGVTTNPSILAKEGGDIREICEYINPLPVSVESGGDIYTEAMDLWKWLSPLNSNLAIKVPFLKPNGQNNLLVIDSLIKEGITINCTATMTLSQVYLASKLGCRYISIFGGRVEDEGNSFFDAIKSCQTYMVDGYLGTNTSIDQLADMLSASNELIVGSIRSIGNVQDCLKAEVDIMTIPPQVLEKMTQHARAQSTSAEFEKDYISVKTLQGINDTQAVMIPHPSPD